MGSDSFRQPASDPRNSKSYQMRQGGFTGGPPQMQQYQPSGGSMGRPGPQTQGGYRPQQGQPPAGAQEWADRVRGSTPEQLRAAFGGDRFGETPTVDMGNGMRMPTAVQGLYQGPQGGSPDYGDLMRSERMPIRKPPAGFMQQANDLRAMLGRGGGGIADTLEMAPGAQMPRQVRPTDLGLYPATQNLRYVGGRPGGSLPVDMDQNIRRPQGGGMAK
jgi:hypothetical protein